MRLRALGLVVLTLLLILLGAQLFNALANHLLLPLEWSFRHPTLMVCGCIFISFAPIALMVALASVWIFPIQPLKWGFTGSAVGATAFLVGGLLVGGFHLSPPKLPQTLVFAFVFLCLVPSAIYFLRRGPNNRLERSRVASSVDQGGSR